MEKYFLIVSICITLLISSYWMLFPKNVREYFVRDYKNNPLKLSDSPIWMESKYADIIFQIIGVVFFLISLFTAYSIIF